MINLATENFFFLIIAESDRNVLLRKEWRKLPLFPKTMQEKYPPTRCVLGPLSTDMEAAKTSCRCCVTINNQPFKAIWLEWNGLSYSSFTEKESIGGRNKKIMVSWV
ncbi:hypothetical protein AVEN_138013-1 [Araneus ventricosus]|uniref:Uncharacterized protein n=1 Tax=Araneus ventricosus TaxID=182803 RepID=A0A4Y2WCN1_ARAVE|nr:hypothetical protein AVEN_223330-1 [Araneus ventricosus]GBO34248.1 hypothetical protein AVEN_17815-1 [Araneus ventricosus]GBO34250.1 hypothetical protein AVEN_130163-1 [Araneus ventricosus]GBO34252.1 hypothetical protein AVEN_138013-1 [Araneus ventricosus]